MKRSHDGLECRHLALRVLVDRDTAAVVDYAYAIPGQKCYFYIVGKTSHGFVAGVIKDLPDEVMETIRPCGPDVHAGTLPDRV